MSRLSARKSAWLAAESGANSTANVGRRRLVDCGECGGVCCLVAVTDSVDVEQDKVVDVGVGVDEVETLKLIRWHVVSKNGRACRRKADAIDVLLCTNVLFSPHRIQSNSNESTR